MAFVVPYHDARFPAEPAAALSSLPTAGGLARGMRSAGWEAAGFHHFRRAARVTQDGVTHTFVAPPAPVRLLGRLAHALWPRHGPAYWQPAPALAEAVAGWHPDVVHVLGMTVDPQVALLARAAGRSGAALVLHYHGGRPDGDALTRRLRRGSFGRAARVAFTHRDQAAPWIAAGMLRAEQVLELPETSTELAPAPRVGRFDPARPRCLFVGRLHALKGPLTAVDAFARVAATRPGARLEVVGPDAGLAAACRAAVAAVPGLGERVTFRGPVPHADMPALYAAADVLLVPSRREWSSLAVIEALAAGVVPVASDLPGLRGLLDEGRVGRLVASGDAAAMAAAVLALDGAAHEAASAHARQHFAARLSFAALGARLALEYARIRSGPAAGPSP